MFLLLLWTVVGCNEDRGNNVLTDTPTSGTIRISVDESFKPVISEQLKVFMSLYPEAKIIPEYKAEADCFRDLDKDSTRMIIVSRELRNNEIKHYKGKLQFDPSFDRIALDAVAVVVNTSSPDSVFTLNDLKAIVSGARPANVAVDGRNATSTVRYLIDSILKGGALGKNVTAAKSSEDVLNYVGNNPGAIGFVGVSWVSELQGQFSKVKMALIECKNCDTETFAKPSQQTITFRQYPLVRGLYYVLKENSTGLGTGFLNFLIHERGQLIFKRAYLVPAKMQLYRRSTNIKESE
jgi:phosphate transport system substrate-binding protein